MYKSLISLNLNLGRLNKSLRKICLCTIVNLLLILFIIVVSFYLIRRLNNNSDSIENFVTNSFGRHICKPTVQNNIKLDPLVKSLDKLSNNLSSIDAKLDYMTGFKSIKSNTKIIDDIDNRDRVVNRKNYPTGIGYVNESNEDDVD